MNAKAKQASQIIESVVKAVGNWTVDDHAVLSPQLPDRYGSDWRNDWIGHTSSQLQMLAQAVSVQSPALFAGSVRWAKQSFKARGAEEGDFVRNLNCMKVVLGRELPASVGEIAVKYVEGAIASIDASDGAHDFDGQPCEAPSKQMLEYLQAILEGDRALAESLILTAQREGSTVPMLYEKVLAPAQARLGWMWHRGEITVADEHLGSATTQSVMAQLRPYFERAEPTGRKVVAAAPPGELHDIGLQMVADLFEIDGWEVVYLGANTPTVDLIEMVQRRRPDLLVISVGAGIAIREAGEIIEQVRDRSDFAEIKVLIGGAPFRLAPELWREMGADGYASSAADALLVGNQLVSAS